LLVLGLLIVGELLYLLVEHKDVFMEQAILVDNHLIAADNSIDVDNMTFEANVFEK
jgi:hypothetical protein